jgi:aquaporin Z
MRQCATEFIGTFFLVLTIGLTVVSGTHLAPVAIGAVLTAMVYMGAHVSGAHYNPAITLAFFLRGAIDAGSVARYVATQVIAAFVAAVVVYAVSGSLYEPAPGTHASWGAALFVEVLFTFALGLVVLNVALADGTSGNSYYGIAIGFTVMAGAFAAGPISGGVLNPAVGLGPILASALLGGGELEALWLYLVGPLAGGSAAAVVFARQQASE